jgi:hypothetical protein
VISWPHFSATPNAAEPRHRVMVQRTADLTLSGLLDTTDLMFSPVSRPSGHPISVQGPFMRLSVNLGIAFGNNKGKSLPAST